MPVRFLCTACRQLLSVSTRKIGSQVSCPKCGSAILVPAVEEAAAGLALAKAAAPLGRETLGLPDFDVDEALPPTIVEPATAAGKLSAEPDYDPELVSFPRRILYAQAVLLAGVAIVAFAIGYLSGRSGPSNLSAQEGNREPVAVVGHVTYHTQAGQTAADGGAVVIAIPQATAVQEKLPIARLRPDAGGADEDNNDIRALESLDGAFARADDRGGFRLLVPPGSYVLLVISKHARRPPGNPPAPHDLSLLDRYFTSAPNLIGADEYHLSTTRLPVDAPLTFDFGRRNE